MCAAELFAILASVLNCKTGL